MHIKEKSTQNTRGEHTTLLSELGLISKNLWESFNEVSSIQTDREGKRRPIPKIEKLQDLWKTQVFYVTICFYFGSTFWSALISIINRPTVSKINIRKLKAAKIIIGVRLPSRPEQAGLKRFLRTLQSQSYWEFGIIFDFNLRYRRLLTFYLHDGNNLFLNLDHVICVALEFHFVLLTNV